MADNSVTNGPAAGAVLPVLVVDGANVVGSRPDGWWRDRPGAARRLLTALVGGLPEPYDVVLVLEGAARPAAEPGTAPGPQPVRVVHVDGSGDDTIVAVVAHAAAGTEPSNEGRAVGEGAPLEGVSPEAVSVRPIVVVTADRELRARVVAHGAQTRGPGWLWEQLDGS